MPRVRKGWEGSKGRGSEGVREDSGSDPRSFLPYSLLPSLCPHDRYLVLCRGEPVYSTAWAQAVVVYLWGKPLRSNLDAPWDYVVLDYEVPHPVATTDLHAWLGGMPLEDEPQVRATLPLRRPCP